VNCSPVTWKLLYWLGIKKKKNHLLEDGTRAISKEHQPPVHKKLLKPNCHLLPRQRQRAKRKNNRAEKKKRNVHVRQKDHTMETCKQVEISVTYVNR